MGRINSNSLGFRKSDVMEAIVDICSGALMLILFGPLLNALRYLLPLHGHPTYRDLFLGVFPDFYKLFSGVSLATSTLWIALAFAVILGFLSRGVFILANAMPTRLLLEPLLTWCAWQQIKKWHGLANWNCLMVKNRIIKGNPFGRVGKEDYARYRAALLEGTGSIGSSARYWDYEGYLFIRSSHFYGLFFTFTSVYCLYGISIVFYALTFGPSIALDDVMIWLAVFAVFMVVSMGLLQEAIIHGVAFVTVDDLLYNQFTGHDGENVQGKNHT